MCTFGIIMFNVYNYVVGLTFKRISFKHFRSSNIFDLVLIEENFFRGLLIMWIFQANTEDVFGWKVQVDPRSPGKKWFSHIRRCLSKLKTLHKWPPGGAPISPPIPVLKSFWDTLLSNRPTNKQDWKCIVFDGGGDKHKQDQLTVSQRRHLRTQIPKQLDRCAKHK